MNFDFFVENIEKNEISKETANENYRKTTNSIAKKEKQEVISNIGRMIFITIIGIVFFSVLLYMSISSKNTDSKSSTLDNNSISSQVDNSIFSPIPNSKIIVVAKTQIGNKGGDKFWKWYGFEEHVQWCACYVSWCANECGYIDKGVIPKFSVCNDGINWFKEKNEWHDRGDSYYPIIGDIIFFDWYDENDNQDGISDHVGIVTRTNISNRKVYTIEGNANNICVEKMYSFDEEQIMGYGSPKYE